MRKTGLLAGFIALTLIVGCESDGCKFTYSKYYIENYVDGDLVLLPYYAVRSSASDLPAPVSEGFGVSIYEGVYYQSPELKGAQHPDEFISHLIDLSPETLLLVARQQRLSLKKPPRTVDEFLDTLLRQQLPRTVAFLNQHKELI